MPSLIDLLQEQNTQYYEKIAELSAHIELLRDAVIGKIDRMQDIAPECGDSAERIIGDFLEVMRPILDETPKQSLAHIKADAIKAADNSFKLAPFTEGVIQSAMRAAAVTVRPTNVKLSNNLNTQAMFIDILFGVDDDQNTPR